MMATRNVDEHQIAQLMKDFTRAALLTQPPNLVDFARAYFNALDTSAYLPIAPVIAPQTPKMEPQVAAEYSNENLKQLYEKLFDMDLDQVQQVDKVKALCESCGTWSEAMRRFVETKHEELNCHLLFLFACSISEDGSMKNFLEALKTIFAVTGDEKGTLEVQQVVDTFADLVMIHEDIDQQLADQMVQHLLGQGFMDSDADVTTKFDGRTTITFQSILEAPCLQEWIQAHPIVV